MTNQEITEYMHEWVEKTRSAPSKMHQLLALAVAIPVLLAEIAKRLPERGGSRDD